MFFDEVGIVAETAGGDDGRAAVDFQFAVLVFGDDADDLAFVFDQLSYRGFPGGSERQVPGRVRS